MHLDKNELTIVYNGAHEKSRKILAYAQTITSKINKQDISSVNVSRNLFCILMEKLGLDTKQLVNKADPYYQEELKNKTYRDSEWFKILRNHPNLLDKPIAYYRGKSVICSTPTDILKLS